MTQAVKQTTDDPRIPVGFVVREYDPQELAPEIRKLGCSWLTTHAIGKCRWGAWCKSYPSAVLAARGRAMTCRKGRFR